MKRTYALSAFTLLAVILSICSLPFSAAESLPDMQVALLDYSPSPAQPGQTIDFTIEVSNPGNPTTDAWLEIVDEYPIEVLPTQDLDRAESLGVVSGTQKLLFRIKIDPDTDDGLVPVRVRYGTGRGQAYQEQTFDIVVETFDARIGISSVKQEPERLAPGEQGKLIIKLTNYDDQPLKNLDVLLDLTGSYDMGANMNNMIAVQAMINARLEDVNRRVAAGLSPLRGATPMGITPDESLGNVAFDAIAPVGSATLTRMVSLDPGETREIEFAVQALPDTQPGIFAIPLYINYNDDDNNPFHVRTEVPVAVDMPADVLIQMKDSTLRSTDFGGEVTILVANRGLGDMQFTNLEFVSDEGYTLLTAPSEIYLGTLKPGESAEHTFLLLAHDEELRIPIRVTFRDSYNNPISVERTLELDIINRNYYRDMPYEMMLPWIILGLVVFAVTGYYMWSLSKRK